jgi:hypothetical protein
LFEGGAGEGEKGDLEGVGDGGCGSKVEVVGGGADFGEGDGERGGLGGLEGEVFRGVEVQGVRDSRVLGRQKD